MSSGYQNFEQLEVWKKARQLKKDIYDLVKTSRRKKNFGLSIS